jgi:hypothetical protein
MRTPNAEIPHAWSKFRQLTIVSAVIATAGAAPRPPGKRDKRRLGFLTAEATSLESRTLAPHVVEVGYKRYCRCNEAKLKRQHDAI